MEIQQYSRGQEEIERESYPIQIVCLEALPPLLTGTQLSCQTYQLLDPMWLVVTYNQCNQLITKFLAFNHDFITIFSYLLKIKWDLEIALTSISQMPSNFLWLVSLQSGQQYCTLVHKKRTILKLGEAIRDSINCGQQCLKATFKQARQLCKSPLVHPLFAICT